MVSLELEGELDHFLGTGGKDGAKACCMHKLICRVRGRKVEEF